MTDASAKANLNFTQSAEKEGWIMAGSFYWSVEQSNKASKTLSVNNLLPTTSATGYMKTAKKDNPNRYNILNGVSNMILTTPFDVNSTSVTYIARVGYYWTQYIGAQQNTSTGTVSATGTSRATVADQMADGALSHFGVYHFATKKQGYNPVVSMMREGQNLIEAVVGIWIGAIALSIGIAAVAGICNSSSPGGVIFQSTLTWLKSILMLITTLLLVPGAILAYYVPLYPFAVYTFAAVGWILMVIEGMAAAPLVCMGLTHPEGHDFLGKAEQALMLFLSIFLRPTLMVVGLIAAMLVSFVAFHLLIAGFGGILASLDAKGGAAFGNGFLILISVCMVMIVFAMITMELIEQSFKLIYQLPNNIMRWIGGPQIGEEYGQMAGVVKSGVTSAGGAAREGMQGLDRGWDSQTQAIDRASTKQGGGSQEGDISSSKAGGGESGGGESGGAAGGGAAAA